jgi:rhodanese-related sulfurtransferase
MMDGFGRVAGAAILAIALGAVSAFADDIPENKRTKLGLYLTAAEAPSMLSDEDVILIDIRSRAEANFLGIPIRANVHIPYMEMPLVPEFNAEKGDYALEINPDFPLDFRRYAEAHGVTEDTPIVLMCRSGTRSAKAADLLAEMGFRQVYTLVDGFEGDKAREGPQAGQRVVNGWKNAGLTWSYVIRPDQAYPADTM